MDKQKLHKLLHVCYNRSIQKDSVPIETIAKYTKLSVEYITKLSKAHNLI